MLRVVTKDIELWNTVVKAASALLEEIALEFHPDRITMRSMDPSHIAMLNLDWLAQSFDEYSCDGEYVLALRIEDLENVIKRASRGESMEITLGEGNTIVFKVSDGYEKEYTLHILESAHTAIPVPKVSFAAKFVITLKGFRDALDDISTVSDQVNIKAEQGRITMIGSSEYGNVKVTMTTSTPDIKEITVQDQASSSYSVEYLQKFVKSLKSGLDFITVEFGSRLPIKVQAAFDDKGSKFEYYLAPRLD